MNGDFYAPNFEIQVEGLTLSADVTRLVSSLTYEDNLDMADMFRIVVHNDGNQLLDSALFDPGKSVAIYMGYGHDLHPMMLGEITALEPSFPESGVSTLTIVGYDKSYRMQHNQTDRATFLLMSDSMIATQIALENGLIPVVDPSPLVRSHHQTTSDMAFLKELAADNFFDVYVDWNRLHFQLSRPQGEAILLEWGRNLSNFSPRISSAGLAGIQVIRGYNQELAQTIVSTALTADLDLGGLIEKLGSNARDLLLSFGRRAIHGSVETPLEAGILAKSILQTIIEGLYEGSGSCIGMPALRAGKYISIQGVGKRFSGLYRLRKVNHTIGDGGYRTDFEIAQRSESNLLSRLRSHVIGAPAQKNAATQKNLAHLQGLMVGDVVKTRESEIGGTSTAVPNKVQVKLPDSEHPQWATCTAPMAGNDRGFYSLPVQGDQVLVAFVQGERTEPYIIGSLWNSKQRPPVSNGDSTGKIVIKDSKGSEIILNAGDGSITISAAGDLTLKAQGKITLEAGQGETKTTITMDQGYVNVT